MSANAGPRARLPHHPTVNNGCSTPTIPVMSTCTPMHSSKKADRRVTVRLPVRPRNCTAQELRQPVGRAVCEPDHPCHRRRGEAASGIERRPPLPCRRMPGAQRDRDGDGARPRRERQRQREERHVDRRAGVGRLLLLAAFPALRCAQQLPGEAGQQQPARDAERGDADSEHRQHIGPGPQRHQHDQQRIGGHAPGQQRPAGVGAVRRRLPEDEGAGDGIDNAEQRRG